MATRQRRQNEAIISVGCGAKMNFSKSNKMRKWSISDSSYPLLSSQEKFMGNFFIVLWKQK
jgi:hypothetical protein